MNKVQFRLFIEDCLAYYVKEVENRYIPSEEHADAWKPYVKPSDMSGLSFKDLPVIDKLILNSHIQELSDKGLKHNLDDVLESKWPGFPRMGYEEQDTQPYPHLQDNRLGNEL